MLPELALEQVQVLLSELVHRLAWPEDVALIGDSLILTREQRDHITKLQVGEAVVSLTRLQRPILVQVKADSVLATDSKDLSFEAEP